MSVALLFVTDGRRQYFERCLQTVGNLDYDWDHRIVVDDSADASHREWVYENADPTLYVSHQERMGGAAAVRTAWRTMADMGVDYVCHVEEDFTFPELVDVQAMIDVLEDDQLLAQMVLRRQRWGGEGEWGYVGDNPTKFTDHDGWLEHRLGFWLNPCVYPTRVTKYGWPEHGHEHHFSQMLLRDGWHMGVWGSRDDPPRCLHIGWQRHSAWTW